MHTRTRGIQLAPSGERTVEKQYRGIRIFARLGKVSQADAETYLREQVQRIDAQLLARERPPRHFCDAAGRYLTDCEKRQLRTINVIAFHIHLLLPYVGKLPLTAVHIGSLQAFIDDRLADGVTPTTVNRSLEVARAILMKAARVWRDADGQPWLATAPLIELLDASATTRSPRPISWEEQGRLFAALPPHLAPMALFAVNTGLRDANVCGLRWAWERPIPELGRSVFIIPATAFKTKRPHVVILNDVAANVIESMRGRDPTFVFTYQGRGYAGSHARACPLDSINNTAWQKARKRVGLERVRVHDLRHTFAQRLRDAGVSHEDRAVLMGHATTTMGEHYATPTIANLIALANRVLTTRDTPTLLRVING